MLHKIANIHGHSPSITTRTYIKQPTFRNAMSTQAPMDGWTHLHCAQETADKILNNRLIQRQHGELRRAVNARIFIDFVRQLKAYDAEWSKRKRIKDSIFRLRDSSRSEQHFEDGVSNLRQKLDLFAKELEMASSVSCCRSSEMFNMEGESETSLESESSGSSLGRFEDAFHTSVNAVLEEVDNDGKEQKVFRRLGTVLLTLWGTHMSSKSSE